MSQGIPKHKTVTFMAMHACPQFYRITPVATSSAASTAHSFIPAIVRYTTSSQSKGQGGPRRQRC